MRSLGGGQVDGERRSFARRARDSHVTTTLGDDCVDGREPQAGPLAQPLRREEGVECASHRLVVHSCSRVRHGELDVAPSGRRAGDAHADRHSPAVGHRVARVDDEVHDDLFELPRIGLDRCARRVQFEDQLDSLAEQRAKHGR
jgi:hypothetical protein